MKKVLIFFFVLAILFVPVSGIEAAPFVGQIVPDCGPDEICGYCHIVPLVQNIIKFVIYLAVVVATLMFVYAGFMYLTAGGSPDKIKSAHKIFWNVFIGLIFVLVAWLIIELVLVTFTDKGFGFWSTLEGC